MHSSIDIHDITLSMLAERFEGDALSDFYAAAPASVARQYGIKALRSDSGTILMAPGLVPIMMFNRALGFGLREPLTDANIDGIVNRFRGAGVRRFGIQLTPDAQPQDVREMLRARGFQHVTNWVRAVRGREPAPHIDSALRIEPINQKDGSSFGEIVCSVFKFPLGIRQWIASTIGRDGWRHYCGFDGEVPVATGAMFVRNDTAWLGFAATLPSHRKLGAQGAIMARRIGDALAQGCRLLITETGEDTPAKPNPSYHNMIRCGFTLAYVRENYVMEFGPTTSADER
jgi:hypothetical protein